jgi:DedD protein
MARPTGDEELQLRKRARRRLIGAVVLVLVVVLVLPMVLESEPRPASQDIDIRIPSPDAGAFKSKIVPIAPAHEGKPPAKGSAAPPSKSESGAKSEPAASAAPVVSSAPAATAGATSGKDATKSPPVADAPKPAARDETPDAGAARAGAAGAGHVVQVAALLNAERAELIHERMKAAGIKSYTEVVKTAKGDVTRVRAGPYPTPEAAERAREQISRIEVDGRKLDGKIIPVK